MADDHMVYGRIYKTAWSSMYRTDQVMEKGISDHSCTDL